MPVARRGQGRIHLVDRGARDAEPLLFVHGWAISTGAFEEFFDRLAVRYRVIAPDLPGFGRSDPLEGTVSYTAYADVLAEILADLGIARAHVAGLSMGGGIALTFAARHPRMVRALILMAPTGCPEVSLPKLAWNRAFEFLEQVLGPADNHGKARVAQAFVANLVGHPASLWATVRMVASRRIVDYARRIEAPTLLLWGERDRTIPPHLARQFFDRLPDAKLHVMPDTFHEMATSRPDQTAGIIHEFIVGSEA